MINLKPKTNKKKPVFNPLGSFAEALKEIGQGTAQSFTQDAIGKTAQNVAENLIYGKTISSPKAAESSFDSRELYLPSQEDQAQAEENKAKNSQFFRYQEKAVVSRREKEIQMQIQVLQEELAKLVGQTETLYQEVKIAASQEIVKPGIYHLRFLESLIKFVQDMSKRVSDSQTWFVAMTTRQSRQAYYWGQVQKSGTKFMLSQERYMSTQAG